MFFFAQNSDALPLGEWWWFLPPGICIAVLGAALALVNFGIDEIANPRLRTERGRKPSLLKRALGVQVPWLHSHTGGNGMTLPHDSQPYPGDQESERRISRLRAGPCMRSITSAWRWTRPDPGTGGGEWQW